MEIKTESIRATHNALHRCFCKARSYHNNNEVLIGAVAAMCDHIRIMAEDQVIDKNYLLLTAFQLMDKNMKSLETVKPGGSPFTGQGIQEIAEEELEYR